MRNLLLLYIIFLVDFCQGSTDVFVLKGEDMRLDVKKPDVPKENLFLWKFKRERELNVIRYSNAVTIVHTNYTGRVEFSTEDFSFRLKNLQEDDSGVYTAALFGDEFKALITYNVTVQESVSPPVLEVNVSSSSDSCNLTVSCSSQNSSISSTVRCDTQTCSQEGGERSEVTAFLYVYLSNDSIICNHSNQVSRNENMKEIKPLCWDSTTPEPEPPIAAIVLSVLAVIGLVSGGVFFRRHQQRGKYNRDEVDTTVYATPEQLNRDHAVPQSPSRDASAPPPCSTYSMIGQHTAPMGPNETRGPTAPESVYATVQKPGPEKNLAELLPV